MKTMMAFKQFDFYMQLVLFTIGLAIPMIDNEYIFFSYFTVGGWQLFSALVHAYGTKYYYCTRDRRRYWNMLLITLVTGILMLPVFLGFLVILLFASPFMALSYIIISYDEIKILRQKLFVHIR